PPPGAPGSVLPPGTSGTSPGGAPSQGAVSAPGSGAVAQERRARRVRATRTRFSTRGPKAQRGTVIRFRLRKPGKVELVVRAERSSCTVIGRKRGRRQRGLPHRTFHD